jgi:RNA polymerase sigma-70 factor, ECF subfamily
MVALPGGHLPDKPAPDVTELLVAWSAGDQAALDRLVPMVYAELRRIAHRHMRGERKDHQLQTTALVHEAYMRLADVNGVQWKNRTHFYAVAAQIMRRVLVDAARERNARKRGADPPHVALDADVLQAPERGKDLVALDEALNRFAAIDPRRARIVELRYFGGLTVEETADVVGASAETVMRDWKVAKLWLLRELLRS